MLKLMVFTLSSDTFFDLGMSEAERFCKMLKNHGWEDETIVNVSDILLQGFSEYEPDFRNKDWCAHFKTWLRNIKAGEHLCLYDGWITNWDEMKNIQSVYRAHVKEKDKQNEK